MVNLVFDFDGTLYNSYGGIKLAFEFSAILVYQSVVELSDANIGPPIMDIHDIYFRNKSSHEKSEFVKTFRELYDNKYCDLGKWYDGVNNFPKQLFGEKFRFICLTNKPYKPLRKILTSQTADIKFDIISCIDDERFKSKLKSERLTMIKNYVNNSTERWIYIGDTIEDYEAAIKNNCMFIHAAYGYGSISNDNLFSIKSLSELMSVLNNAFK